MDCQEQEGIETGDDQPHNQIDANSKFSPITVPITSARSQAADGDFAQNPKGDRERPPVGLAAGVERDSTGDDAQSGGQCRKRIAMALDIKKNPDQLIVVLGPAFDIGCPIAWIRYSRR